MTADKPPRLSRSTAAFLTVHEVCAQLGIARSTFYDWRAQQKGPHCLKLPNGEIRIRRQDLDQWLTSLEERP